ncbi:hypothetical protein [Streptomyces rimosus]|uniref:hypothetical protein n=1 Tax=Streptomyces rimosus TaxID=1927 RepID=UPI00378C43FE
MARTLLPTAALCLAALLSACGDGGRGHAAVGAAGPADGRSPTKPVPPGEDIVLTPLDGATPEGRRGDSPSEDAPSPESGSGIGTGTDTTPTRTPPAPSPPGHRAGPAEPPSGASPGSPPSAPHGTPPGTPSSPAPTPTPAPKPKPKPPTPPHLALGPLQRAEADVRWCEKVTVDLRNTGGRPVTYGTITFGTHIIGALGIDWTTRTSTHPLPTPLPATSHRTATWRVCVASWRVPLGMHVETREVRTEWG